MPPIGHMDWIGFRKLDPRPTLSETHANFFRSGTYLISLLMSFLFLFFLLGRPFQKSLRPVVSNPIRMKF